MSARIFRHAWNEKCAQRHERHTDRTCTKCGIIQRTRHEEGRHWLEYWRGDKLVSVEERPNCRDVEQ